ncbi:MAG: hypothetical protein WBC44_08000 [Planctomycetaceae bacterium]
MTNGASRDTPGILISEDPTCAGVRIVVDAASRTVTFHHCHIPRSFLTVHSDAVRVCRFDEILAAHDFGPSQQRGFFLLISLAGLGGVDHRSLFISTPHGRCRVFANWSHFEELHDALQQVATGTGRGSWEDDPRVILPIALLIGAVILAVIWLLL